MQCLLVVGLLFPHIDVENTLDRNMNKDDTESNKDQNLIGKNANMGGA